MIDVRDMPEKTKERMSSSNKKVKPIFFVTAQQLIIVRITVFFQ